jgi:heme exporter protein D
MMAMLHGDAPFGWQGFAFAALAVVALVVVFNELARGALTNRPKKRKRNKSTTLPSVNSVKKTLILCCS